MECVCRLTGKIRDSVLTGHLAGETPLSGAIPGTLEVYIPVLDLYEGPVDVIPGTALQTLPTKHKTLAQDVTVQAIPYAEVTNPSGGTTVTIGGNIHGE